MLKVVEAAERGDFQSSKRIGRLAAYHHAMEQLFLLVGLASEVLNDDWRGFMPLVVFVRQLLMWQVKQAKVSTMTRIKVGTPGSGLSGLATPTSSRSKRTSITTVSSSKKASANTPGSVDKQISKPGSRLNFAMAGNVTAKFKALGSPIKKYSDASSKFSSSKSGSSEIVTEKKIRLANDGPYHFWSRRGLAGVMKKMLWSNAGSLLEFFLDAENARGMTPMDLAAHKMYDHAACVMMLRARPEAGPCQLAQRWPESIGKKSAKALRDFGDDIDMNAAGGEDPLHDMDLSRTNALEILSNRVDRINKRADSRPAGTTTVDDLEEDVEQYRTIVSECQRRLKKDLEEMDKMEKFNYKQFEELRTLRLGQNAEMVELLEAETNKLRDTNGKYEQATAPYLERVSQAMQKHNVEDVWDDDLWEAYSDAKTMFISDNVEIMQEARSALQPKCFRRMEAATFRNFQAVSDGTEAQTPRTQAKKQKTKARVMRLESMCSQVYDLNYLRLLVNQCQVLGLEGNQDNQSHRTRKLEKEIEQLQQQRKTLEVAIEEHKKNALEQEKAVVADHQKLSDADVTISHAQEELHGPTGEYEDAMTALDCVSQQEIVELRSTRIPTETLDLALRGVCVLFRLPCNNWEVVSQMLAHRDFLNRVCSYDLTRLHERGLLDQLKEIINHPKFSVEEIQRLSPAGMAFAKWIKAMYLHATIIGPHELDLAHGREMERGIVAGLEAKEQGLKALLDKIEFLTINMNELLNHESHLEEQLQLERDELAEVHDGESSDDESDAESDLLESEASDDTTNSVGPVMMRLCTKYFNKLKRQLVRLDSEAYDVACMRVESLRAAIDRNHLRDIRKTLKLCKELPIEKVPEGLDMKKQAEVCIKNLKDERVVLEQRITNHAAQADLDALEECFAHDGDIHRLGLTPPLAVQMANNQRLELLAAKEQAKQACRDDIAAAIASRSREYIKQVLSRADDAGVYADDNIRKTAVDLLQHLEEDGDVINYSAQAASVLTDAMNKGDILALRLALVSTQLANVDGTIKRQAQQMLVDKLFEMLKDNSSATHDIHMVLTYAERMQEEVPELVPVEMANLIDESREYRDRAVLDLKQRTEANDQELKAAVKNENYQKLQDAMCHARARGRNRSTLFNEAEQVLDRLEVERQGFELKVRGRKSKASADLQQILDEAERLGLADSAELQSVRKEKQRADAVDSSTKALHVGLAVRRVAKFWRLKTQARILNNKSNQCIKKLNSLCKETKDWSVLIDALQEADTAAVSQEHEAYRICKENAMAIAEDLLTQAMAAEDLRALEYALIPAERLSCNQTAAALNLRDALRAAERERVDEVGNQLSEAIAKESYGLLRAALDVAYAYGFDETFCYKGKHPVQAAEQQLKSLEFFRTDTLKHLTEELDRESCTPHKAKRRVSKISSLVTRCIKYGVPVEDPDIVRAHEIIKQLKTFAVIPPDGEELVKLWEEISDCCQQNHFKHLYVLLHDQKNINIKDKKPIWREAQIKLTEHLKPYKQAVTEALHRGVKSEFIKAVQKAERAGLPQTDPFLKECWAELEKERIAMEKAQADADARAAKMKEQWDSVEKLRECVDKQTPQMAA
eukprot:gene848-839_t